MKIAIVRLSAMGDIVHSAVALQFIKQKFPEVTIDWIVEKSMAPILQNNPDIDTIIPVELKKFKKTRKLSNPAEQIRILKSLQPYDYVIDMQGLIKSAMVAKVIKGKSHGYDKNSIREKLAARLYNHTYHLPYDMNTIDRNAGLISKVFDFNVTPEEIHAKQPFLFYKDEAPIVREYLKDDQKNIVFVIGSTWPSRNYPRELFAEVANTLKEKVLIIWGSDREHDDAKYIAEHSQYAQVMPCLDLNSLKALIGQSNLTIGNDTGPTHMAWGMNRPSITIFGPTPVSRVYQTAINKIVKSPSKINPYKLNKEDFSIKEISPNMIVVLAKELLNQDPEN